MPSVLVASSDFHGYDLAFKLAREGNDVTFFHPPDVELPDATLATTLRATSSKRFLTGEFDIAINVTGGIFGQLFDELAERGTICISGGGLANRINKRSHEIFNFIYGYQSGPSQGETTCAITLLRFFLGPTLGWDENLIETISQDRLAEGNRGPLTTLPMGLTSVRSTRPSYFELYTKLTPVLEKLNYRGPVVLSVIDGYVHSLTCNLIFPSYVGLFELVKRNKLYASLFAWTTRSKPNVRLKEGTAIAVSTAYIGDKTITLDFEPDALEHIHPTGTTGMLCVITSQGADVFEARRRVKRTIQHANLPVDVMYRTDIGLVIEDAPTNEHSIQAE